MKRVQFEWDEEKNGKTVPSTTFPFLLLSTHFLIRTVSLLKMLSIALQKIDIIALVVSAKGL
jgi:hypothetical protein